MRTPSSRVELEGALRRSLAFHCSSCTDNSTLFFEAILDDAETGSIQEVGDVAACFDDYLPEADLEPNDRDEMFEDMLRWKFSPAGDPKRLGKQGNRNGRLHDESLLTPLHDRSLKLPWHPPLCEITTASEVEMIPWFLNTFVIMMQKTSTVVPDPPQGLSSGPLCALHIVSVRDILKRFPVASGHSEGNMDDDDEELLPSGCCSMCERNMPLTRHHVMPRSTHKRYKKKGYSEEVLRETIDICRPCHSAIHRTHDHITLAEYFRTVESLLQDEDIAKFVAWVRKQRTTRKDDAGNPLLLHKYRK
ncbi:unnamed protein product [Discosporangium mesarthrocarpum]